MLLTRISIPRLKAGLKRIGLLRGDVLSAIDISLDSRIVSGYNETKFNRRMKSRRINMQRQVHQFDNGVKVYDDHLIQALRDRYEEKNIHEPEEEDTFVSLIKAIPEEGCFVNIGAAVGYYVILAKIISPSLIIHAFEPLGMHREYLKENLELNEIDSSAIKVHGMGVSSSNNVMYLSENGYGSKIRKNYRTRLWLGRLLVSKVIKCVPKALVPAKLADKKPISRIRTIDLNTLVKKIDKSIDLLQMDIQGGEVDVLAGGTKTLKDGNIKKILIGTHGRENHETCAEILNANDYVIDFEQKDPQEQNDGVIVARPKA